MENSRSADEEIISGGSGVKQGETKKNVYWYESARSAVPPGVDHVA
jgi:hypothetical protein